MTSFQIQQEIPSCVEYLLRHKVPVDSDTCEANTRTLHPVKDSGDPSEPSNDRLQESTQESSGDSGSQRESCNSAHDTPNTPDSDSDEQPEENPAAFEKYKATCRTLRHYLERQDEPSLIPEKFFRRFWVMDIVTEDHRNCCCFTKR